MPAAETPPVVSVVGRKNSGKTTLLVALAAGLKRQGYRVATIKHGHHEFEIDQPGRDSWRHFHEGSAEAVLMVAAGKLGLVMRTPESEPEPEALVARFFAGRGYDLVLVEGFKHGPFPKIEVFRSEIHAQPVHAPESASAKGVFAILTDAGPLDADVPVVPLVAGADAHVAALIELIERRILSVEPARGVT